MNRFLTAAVVSTAILATSPAFSADLVVEAPAVAPAAGQTGFYATFFAGGTLPSSTLAVYEGDYDAGTFLNLGYGAGYIVGAAIGTQVFDNLRGEIEFSYGNANIDEFFGAKIADPLDSVDYAVLGNLWYDFKNDSSFTPYIGAGAGYDWTVVTADGYDGQININGFVYQLGAGVRFAAAENITLDVGYRYRVQPDAEATVDSADFTLPDEVTATVDGQNHIVQAGVSFNF